MIKFNNILCSQYNSGVEECMRDRVYRDKQSRQ